MKNIKVYLAVKNLDKEKFNEFNVVGSSQNGNSVYSEVQALKPDVLVTDILLDSIDGFELIDLLKSNMEEKCPKIIVASELTHKDFISKALQMGAIYYINKFNVNEIIQKIYEAYNSNSNYVRIDLLDEKISGICMSGGIPINIRGYSFIKEAIKLTIKNPEIINHVTKRLYPEIAEKFNTTSSRVERAIRHAIEVAYNRERLENINKIFGVNVFANNEKPTNSEFIAVISEFCVVNRFCV